MSYEKLYYIYKISMHFRFRWDPIYDRVLSVYLWRCHPAEGQRGGVYSRVNTMLLQQFASEIQPSGCFKVRLLFLQIFQK